ncbi:histidine phosphatase family protein [Salipaludibacillus agaradhaerens]|uniref:Histidine phosphatase family protein n=1 Tax=Salipaludibacillus agaradhaerens TaxID=76935 RepID=A0A9Q4FUU6_SALAG|nr:histidine phosphatase family protein [Salipaludibacillus agaradhaerens]MCR6095175.1 histidine phosphatase family protein [Salipaludibacillus agaradhaerens]MCR6115267.1 histidine phosphatase family protein [Salipaludibacillus agaradhaerens]
MRIALIRHGESHHRDDSPVTKAQLSWWIKIYNQSGVRETEIFPTDTIKAMTMSSFIVTSDLKRAIDSAALLKPDSNRRSDSLFREAELPVPYFIPSWLKMRPALWLVLLRCLWLVGVTKGCESLREAETRAEKAAAKLISYAEKEGSVVLVGHGVFNRLIAKQLRKKGWRGNKKTKTTHWSCTMYDNELNGDSVGP